MASRNRLVELVDVADNIEYEKVRNLENWVASTIIIIIIIRNWSRRWTSLYKPWRVLRIRFPFLIVYLTRVSFICTIKRLTAEEMENGSSTPNCTTMESGAIAAPSDDRPSTSRSGLNTSPPNPERMIEGGNDSLPSPIPSTTRYQSRNKKDVALSLSSD